MLSIKGAGEYRISGNIWGAFSLMCFSELIFGLRYRKAAASSSKKRNDGMTEVINPQKEVVVFILEVYP